MVYTGPQKYPGANTTSSWYQDNYGGDRMEVNVVVWHTTEGRTLPDYNGGAQAPNLTAVPDFAAKRLKWYQHFDIDRSSRALVNKSGGVETNTLNACQIELVGTCDPSTHKRWTDAGYQHIYWPEAPDWALADLGRMVDWLYVNHGIRRESTVTWKAYPGSYGATSTRLTNAEWTGYYGHLGHQHVPENDHGDPGNLKFSRVIQFAKGEINTGGEEDVALTDEDVKKIWDHGISNRFRPDAAGNPKVIPARYYLEWNDSHYDDLIKKIESVSTGGVDLDALAAKVAGNPALADAIAEKVAAKLAARLAD